MKLFANNYEYQNLFAYQTEKGLRVPKTTQRKVIEYMQHRKICMFL